MPMLLSGADSGGRRSALSGEGVAAVAAAVTAVDDDDDDDDDDDEECSCVRAWVCACAGLEVVVGGAAKEVRPGR